MDADDAVIRELGLAYLDAILEYGAVRRAAWARFVAACAARPRPTPAPNYPQGVDIEVPRGDR